MTWVWITALVWVLLAVPLALLIGRHLHRSDQRRTFVPPPFPDEAPPLAGRRPPSDRRAGASRLPDSIARVVHPPARHPADRERDTGPASLPLPAASRRRFPPHRRS